MRNILLIALLFLSTSLGYASDQEPVFRSTLFANNKNSSETPLEATEAKSLKVTISDSQTGAVALVTQTNSLKVAQTNALNGDAFGDGDMLPTKWNISETNGCTSDPLPGEMSIDTNGSANASCRCNSIDVARFIFAQFNTIHFGYQLLDMGAVNNIREFGAFDPTDLVSPNGVFVRFNQLTVEIVTVKNGSETIFPSASFDKPFLNDGKVHVMEIFWNAGKIEVRQDNRLIKTLLAEGEPFFQSPHLHVGMANYNINGGTADVELRMRASGSYRNGEPSQQKTYSFIDSGQLQMKNGPGQLGIVNVTRTSGAGSAQTVTVYDNIACDLTGLGRIIHRITMSTNDTKSIPFNVNFNNGLCIDLSTAQFDVNVTWD